MQLPDETFEGLAAGESGLGVEEESGDPAHL
jgi:hypothetical protein